MFVCLFSRARKQGNSKKLKQFLEYIWVRVSTIAPISATPQRCLRSSKLTICWPSHFVILLCDSNRSTIRRFSVRLSKSENSFELQIIFKMLIFISVISLTRGKSKGNSRNFRVSCYSSGGHKTHHFHFITLDILCLSSPACVSSKLLSKVAQIWSPRFDECHFVTSFLKVNNLRRNTYLIQIQCPCLSSFSWQSGQIAEFNTKSKSMPCTAQSKTILQLQPPWQFSLHHVIY